MPTTAHNHLSTNPKIVVLTAYFEKFSKLLKRSRPRTVTNYLLLYYTTYWADDLGDEYDEVEVVSGASLRRSASRAAGEGPNFGKISANIFDYLSAH